MNKIIISAVVILGMCCYSCSDDDNDNTIANKSNKEKVVERLKSIETGDTTSNAYMNPNKYIQHNLAIADGHEGFEAVMASLPPGSARVNTVRVFEDGDYVFAHTDYDFFGPQIGIDIFRFENGLMVEHWDNLQVTPETNNPSGRSMIDGVTRVTDLRRTDENKELARRFVENVMIEQNLGVLDNYFDDGGLIQHNPLIGDGVPALRAALTTMFADGLVYERIHKVMGEGNFVLVISEGIRNGESTSFYDLFRISRGDIEEHWDVIERIPPRSEWRNQNGKFNFPY